MLIVGNDFGLVTHLLPYRQKKMVISLIYLDKSSLIKRKLIMCIFNDQQEPDTDLSLMMSPQYIFSFLKSCRLLLNKGVVILNLMYKIKPLR